MASTAEGDEAVAEAEPTEEEPLVQAAAAAEAADADPAPPSGDVAPPEVGGAAADEEAEVDESPAASVQANSAKAQAPAAAPAQQVPPQQAPEPAEPSPAEVREQRISTIFTMARQQNFQMLNQILETYPEHWTECDDEGHSLLHWGALVGNKDFVAQALQKGCRVNAQAQNKQTPLMWASLRGHVPVMRVLMDAKADIQHHDSLGATPVMIALQHRQYRSFLLLMNRGDERLLGDTDNNGCTSAHWAAYKGDLKSLQLLDYFGTDLQRTDNSGMLPLHRATCASEASVIEFLVEKRCDPMMKNKEGKTCIDIADDNHSFQLQHLFKRLAKKDHKKSQEQHDIEEGTTSTDEKGEKKKDKDEGFFSSITKDKAAQKAFPVFWLVCVSLATFEYLMELRALSYSVAPVASVLFELGIPASLAIFFYVALTDPGIVPKGVKGRSGVEALMKALDGGAREGEEPDIGRLCTTSWVMKDLRTKYCTSTGACVEEFDHYCVWLNTSIGKGNHRQFVCLALTEWFTQLVHIYLCWCMMRELVSFSSVSSFIFGVIAGYPLLTVIFIVQCLTCPWVLMLIIHQLRLVIMNLTTNEVMNMHRYDHFWAMKMVEPGRMQKQFRNPFNKGGGLGNCLDFWWHKRRSVQVSQPETSGGHGHGQGGQSSHGHSHGDDGQCCSQDHGSHGGQGHGHGHH